MINAADFKKWLDVYGVDTGGGAASGVVSPGTINEMAFYAASGDTVSGLTTANNGLLSTNGSGVPAINNTVDLVGQFNVDNLRFDGNTISTTNTNGSLVLAPNGVGNITSARNISLSAGVNSGITVSTANTFAGASATSGYSFTTGSGIGLLTSFSTSYTLVAALAGRVMLGSNSSVTGGILIRPDAGGFTVTANGSVSDANLLVNSSGNTVLSGSLATPGIILNGGTTLSDYEEGTWTPTFTFITPGDLSVVYSTQVGKYTRVGDTVTIHVRIVWTPTYSTANGQARIGNLPFAGAATLSGGGAVTLTGTNLNWGTSMTSLSAFVTPAQAFATLKGIRSLGPSSTLTTSNFISGQAQTLEVSLTYNV